MNATFELVQIYLTTVTVAETSLNNTSYYASVCSGKYILNHFNQRNHFNQTATAANETEPA